MTVSWSSIRRERWLCARKLPWWKLLLHGRKLPLLLGCRKLPIIRERNCRLKCRVNICRKLIASPFGKNVVKPREIRSWAWRKKCRWPAACTVHLVIWMRWASNILGLKRTTHRCSKRMHSGCHPARRVIWMRLSCKDRIRKISCRSFALTEETGAEASTTAEAGPRVRILDISSQHFTNVVDSSQLASSFCYINDILFT